MQPASAPTLSGCLELLEDFDVLNPGFAFKIRFEILFIALRFVCFCFVSPAGFGNACIVKANLNSLSLFYCEK